MESVGKTGRWVAVLLVSALGAIAAGCGGGGSHAEGGVTDAKKGDAPGVVPDAGDVRADATPDAICGNDATTKRAVAQACGCDGDCMSGHCVDGVCCSTACNEGCKTCSAAGSMGTCTTLIAGSEPRDATACKAAPASTCG